MHWATLRRHSDLFWAATSATSQVIPTVNKSLLTVLLQFVRGRPVIVTYISMQSFIIRSLFDLSVCIQYLIISCLNCYSPAVLLYALCAFVTHSPLNTGILRSRPNTDVLQCVVSAAEWWWWWQRWQTTPIVLWPLHSSRHSHSLYSVEIQTIRVPTLIHDLLFLPISTIESRVS